MLGYREFCAELPPAKRASDPLWTQILLRPLSFPVAWVLYRAGMSANAVSLMGLLIGIAGCAMILVPNLPVALCGAILLNVVALLDCVDGNIARARKESGPNGEWIDAIVGYAVYMLLPLALGVRAGLEDGGTIDGIPVLLGGIASAFNMFARLVHQKFESAQLKAGVLQTAAAPKSGGGSIVKRISSEIGLCGLMMPFLVGVVILRAEFLFLVFYAGVFFVVAIGTTAKRVTALYRHRCLGAPSVNQR